VLPQASVSEGLLQMTRHGLGMTAIVDEHDHILGIFTDGDLRRALDRRLDVHKARMEELMTRGCRTIRAEQLAAAAVELMDKHKINALLVVDDDERLIGALNVHDLMRAGVM